MEAESGKRKVDFVTLTQQQAPTLKKQKNETSKFSEKEAIDSNFKSTIGGILLADQAANFSLNRYLSIFKEKMKSAALADSERLTESLLIEIKNLKQNNPNFLKQTHFQNLFDFYANEMENIGESVMAIKSHEDLLKELHRMSMKIPAPQTSKRANASYIQKLTISLLKVVSKIDKAQSKELSLDDLEHDNEFTKLPILYKTALKLWRKRETLMHRCTLTGHHMYAKFEYHGTDNSLVNKMVETLFNQYLNRLKKNEDDDIMGKSAGNSGKIKHKPAPYKHFSFFTIIELKKRLSTAIADHPDIKDFELTDKILTKIYRDLLSEIKQRRQNSQKESLRVLELSGDDGRKTVVDEHQNPEIVEKLDLSEKRGLEALEELIRQFREKDLQQNKSQNDNENDDKPLGWDDKDEENDEEEDPEASDEAEVVEEDASSSSDYDDDDDDNQNGITVANNNEKIQANDAKQDDHQPETTNKMDGDEEIAIIEEEDSGGDDDDDDDDNCITLTDDSSTDNNPPIQSKDGQN